MRTRRSLLAIAVIAVALSGACSTTSRSSAPRSSEPRPSTPSDPTGSTGSTTAASTTSPAADPAHAALAAMSEAQRVGQLFMVGTPANAPDPRVAALVQAGQVGSVFLAGNTTLAAAETAALVAALQQSAGSTRLFVATDQEGGTVQRLAGPDFAPIPSALVQGGQPATTERTAAAGWAAALVKAGVNLNLAPVLDTVPSAAFAPHNPPIGALEREFGYSPDLVATAGTAFAQGMLDGGVDPTVKHFPGLGRVTGNTDTSTGVTDSMTTRTDPDLAPFATAINAGAPFVMMSLAIYAQIDPKNPAAFSATIVTGLLRGDLHFAGVVISDDLGATRQVSAYSIGERAVDFIAAGGDIVLDVAVDQIAPMATAVLTKAAADPAFAAQVDAAALQVLQAKQARGLLR